MLALTLVPATVATAEEVEPTGGFTGTVVVPTPAVPEDVSVIASLTTGSQSVGRASVEPDGSYTLEGLADGSYFLEFHYLGVEPVLSEWHGGVYLDADAVAIDVVGGALTTADATLENGAVITLDVTEDGQPLGPVKRPTIQFLGTGETHGSQPPNRVGTRWLEDGLVTLPMIPGSYRMDFLGDRWFDAGLSIVVGESGDADLVVAPGLPASHAVDLQRRSTVSGRIMMETSDGPVTRSGRATIYEASNPTDPYPDSNFTLEDGRFELDGLEAGDYLLNFKGGIQAIWQWWNGAPSRETATPLTVGEAEHIDLGDIVLEQGGFVEGRVVAPDGEGGFLTPTTTISIWGLDEASGVYSPVYENVASSDGSFGAKLSPGTYTVYARPEDPLLNSQWYLGARYFVQSLDVEVVAGETTVLPDMVLAERTIDIFERVAGESRYETAVEVTQTMYATGERAPVVYLADALNFPDALAAGPAAATVGGAILPVRRAEVPAVVLNELERLDPMRIVVAGGTAAISDTVIDQVRDRLGDAVPIERLAGASRYQTADLIARDAFRDGAPIAFVATGRNYPDALAAGAAAGAIGAPVILVSGSASSVSPDTTALLRDLGVRHVYIAGGTAAVSTGIESELTSLLGVENVVRLAGDSRYETAAVIGAEVFESTEFTLLASGRGFADALAGGPLAAMLGAPLYLASPNCIAGQVLDQIWAQNTQGVVILGGESVLGTRVDQLASC
ncbi:hypothetical protein GCM10025877_21090 [Agromyces mangrovi Wang et al. 2018]|nr:hypothetical protein GCM10025877_21090 [Agromyces mangrovi]